jgi:hypothetical protein
MSPCGAIVHEFPHWTSDRVSSFKRGRAAARPLSIYSLVDSLFELRGHAPPANADAEANQGDAEKCH